VSLHFLTFVFDVRRDEANETQLLAKMFACGMNLENKGAFMASNYRDTYDTERLHFLALGWYCRYRSSSWKLWLGTIRCLSLFHAHAIL
jgi:hypothetical protein